jgi:hypothetical protein
VPDGASAHDSPTAIIKLVLQGQLSAPESHKENVMRVTKLILLSATIAALSGCATKGYVDESIATLEARQNAQLSAHEQMLEDLSVTSRDALERATDAGVLAVPALQLPAPTLSS